MRELSKCDFASNLKLVNETCPKCDSAYLLEVVKDTGTWLVCPNNAESLPKRRPKRASGGDFNASAVQL